MPHNPTATARRRLDDRLAGVSSKLGARPPRGWIRAIRDALGMTTADMATRMGVSQARISQIERSEVKGAIRLDTLERAAQALNCRLHYILVPNEPLEVLVHNQALAAARARVARAAHNMRLEDQVPEAPATEDQIETLAEDLVDSRGLWHLAI